MPAPARGRLRAASARYPRSTPIATIPKAGSFPRFTARSPGASDRTTDAARKVSQSSATDLKNSLEILSSSLNSLNSTLAQGSYTVAVAQEQVRKYFDQWAQETNAMPSDLQQTSQERQAQAAVSFKSLRGSIDNVRKNTWPFMNDLNAVDQYLRTDQTQAGIDAVSPRISRTLEVEPVIQRDLDQVIAQIDAIQSTGK